MKDLRENNPFYNVDRLIPELYRNTLLIHRDKLKSFVRNIKPDADNHHTKWRLVKKKAKQLAEPAGLPQSILALENRKIPSVDEVVKDQLCHLIRNYHEMTDASAVIDGKRDHVLSNDEYSALVWKKLDDNYHPRSQHLVDPAIKFLTEAIDDITEVIKKVR